ncbi:MAG TPA: type II toxin-antitoxin system VapC family toxin [Afipia sp.]
MSEFVLDASALLAMLNEEPGGAKVADNIASARICVINYAEVISHFIRLGMPERDIDAMLVPLPMEVVPADKGLGKIAGRLRRVTAQAGLSLGDRFCLALALRDGLRAWTADKVWKTVEKDVEVDIVTIR